MATPEELKRLQAEVGTGVPLTAHDKAAQQLLLHRNKGTADHRNLAKVKRDRSGAQSGGNNKILNEMIRSSQSAPSAASNATTFEQDMARRGINIDGGGSSVAPPPESTAEIFRMARSYGAPAEGTQTVFDEDHASKVGPIGAFGMETASGMLAPHRQQDLGMINAAPDGATPEAQMAAAAQAVDPEADKVDEQQRLRDAIAQNLKSGATPTADDMAAFDMSEKNFAHKSTIERLRENSFYKDSGVTTVDKIRSLALQRQQKRDQSLHAQLSAEIDHKEAMTDDETEREGLRNDRYAVNAEMFSRTADRAATLYTAKLEDGQHKRDAANEFKRLGEQSVENARRYTEGREDRNTQHNERMELAKTESERLKLKDDHDRKEDLWQRGHLEREAARNDKLYALQARTALQDQALSKHIGERLPTVTADVIRHLSRGDREVGLEGVSEEARAFLKSGALSRAARGDDPYSKDYREKLANKSGMYGQRDTLEAAIDTFMLSNPGLDAAKVTFGVKDTKEKKAVEGAASKKTEDGAFPRGLSPTGDKRDYAAMRSASLSALPEPLQKDLNKIRGGKASQANIDKFWAKYDEYHAFVKS